MNDRCSLSIVVRNENCGPLFFCLPSFPLQDDSLRRRFFEDSFELGGPCSIPGTRAGSYKRKVSSSCLCSISGRSVGAATSDMGEI